MKNKKSYSQSAKVVAAPLAAINSGNDNNKQLWWWHMNHTYSEIFIFFQGQVRAIFMAQRDGNKIKQQENGGKKTDETVAVKLQTLCSNNKQAERKK